MAVFQTITYIKYDDGLITIAMTPPQPIGQWSIHFQLNRQAEISVSGLVNKYVGSGYNNVSGINITSSGQGTFNVGITSTDTAALNTGTYYYTAIRTDSGFVSVLSEGYFILQP
jgi:hypothetical protein